MIVSTRGFGQIGFGDGATNFSPYYSQVAGLSQDDANRMGWILYSHDAALDVPYLQALAANRGNFFAAWRDYVEGLIANGIRWDPINHEPYLGDYTYQPATPAQMQQIFAPLSW